MNCQRSLVHGALPCQAWVPNDDSWQLRHGWGWQTPQTASHTIFRHIQSVWAHSYAVNGHTSAALNRYTHCLGHILGVWVTCGVKILSLCHGWGWQTPQSASHTIIRHIHSFWAHSYAVNGLTAAALNRYTHYLGQIWGSGSLVESKYCHYIMFEANRHLKLLPTPFLDIYRVFEHIDICRWAYGSSLKQLYPQYLAQILGFWVTWGVKILS